MNAVARIVILAATLALSYYFVIRPVLETTETLNEKSSEVHRCFKQANGEPGRLSRCSKRWTGE